MSCRYIYIFQNGDFFYIFKGLVARCHPFCLFWYLYITYIHSITFIKYVHSSVAISGGSSPSPHRWSALWEKHLWGAAIQESNSGLPYSKPSHHQLITPRPHPSWASPHPIWAKLHPSRATPHPNWNTPHPSWATPHPLTELHNNLFELRRTLTDLRRTLFYIQCNTYEPLALPKRPS
jgi:hypothetical protein